MQSNVAIDRGKDASKSTAPNPTTPDAILKGCAGCMGTARDAPRGRGAYFASSGHDCGGAANQNWSQIVPHLISFKRNTSRRLQEEIFARVEKPHRQEHLEAARAIECRSTDLYCLRKLTRRRTGQSAWSWFQRGEKLAGIGLHHDAKWRSIGKRKNSAMLNDVVRDW
jgi:hypothetical protein